jgi:hypothetical protein
MMKVLPALLVLLTAGLAACGNTDSAGPSGPVNRSPAEPSPGFTADGQPVNAMGAATLEFHRRLQAYLEIHQEADGKVPSLRRTDDPVEIAKRETALAEMIMTLRAGAQPGDIFAAEYQPHLVKIVRDDFARRSAADRRALVWELPKNMKVDVNTAYPTDIPLATFPAALLKKLPDLPPELEYRIVGRSLILRDVNANLIVDVLRDVVPTIPS